jgi:hypothetical protein
MMGGSKCPDYVRIVKCARACLSAVHLLSSRRAQLGWARPVPGPSLAGGGFHHVDPML